MKGHGGDIFDASERIGATPEEILDFSSSVNPLGPPPQVAEVLAQTMPAVVRYPDVECRRLRRKLGEVFGLEPERLLIGNGSTELIYLLHRRLLPRRAATFPPCYLDYWRAAEQSGADVAGYVCAPEQEFTVSQEALSGAAATAEFMWLGNPNNPTGTAIERERLLQLAAEHPQVTFALDEAFVEFLDEPAKYSLLAADAPANVIVIRSLTKSFAIPGLRLGFLAAAPETVRHLAAGKEPWSVNGPALAVGERLYDDPDYLRKTRELVAQERDFLVGELTAIGGLRPFHSRACFVLVRIEVGGLTAAILKQQLLAHRILIRDASNLRGLNGRYVRFAVKTREDNVRLIEALRQVLAAAKPGSA